MQNSIQPDSGETSQVPARGGQAVFAPGRNALFAMFLMLLALTAAGCAGQLQTKISGHLDQLSRNQLVAILPPQLTGDGQHETAAMFRRSLHANLQQAQFNLMERHVVDALLLQNKLNHPAQYPGISPLKFGEVLGADAVVISRINRVERSYLLLHSSIEVGVSVEMVDTRTGEILWRADQTESDFDGIAKIPTGMSSAVLAPIQFVTNKLNLHKITHSMVTKLTNLVKQPEQAEDSQKFEEPVIAKAAQRDLDRLAAREARQPVQVAAATPPHRPATETPSKAALWDKMDVIPRAQPRPTPVAANPGEQIAALSQTQTELPRVRTQASPAPAPKAQVRQVENVRVATLDKPDTGLLYTLQVGAYKTKAYAERLMQSLVKQGHNAFVSWFKKDDERIYRVHVDQFGDKQSAERASRDLEEAEHLDTFVTTVQPR